MNTPESADVIPVDTEGPWQHTPAFEGLGAEFTTVWSVAGIWDLHVRYIPTKSQNQGGTHVAVDVAKDGLCAGISCHIDYTSIGFEPPFCRNHSGGTQCAR